MLGKRGIDPNLAPFSRALALVVAVGLSAVLAGCADIHPARDDSDTGMVDESNEGAMHERDEEAESEHVAPGEGRPR
jgi:hypothetical protein